ncbi:multi PDZ domain protein 1-like protein [Euroglyphus maynei]|uniref:Multi PDZ domain protein 1-like protein n=1 Tax=Euroglyphus maynei TaxID=6958 RepID=A0A1Y3B4T2_EURMA|nr:multi PDZ domain protein 1-like protein [Euroglyphus maynei]
MYYLSIPLNKKKNRNFRTKEIEIEKGPDGFGFSIVGGYGSAHGNLPICIRKIFPNSRASIDGRLHEGDIIIAINNIDITKFKHDQVVELLKNINGKVRLLIYDMNNSSSSSTTS